MPAGAKPNSRPEPVLWPKLASGSDWFVDAYPIDCKYEAYEDAYRIQYYDEATHSISAILLHVNKIEHFFSPDTKPRMRFEDYVKMVGVMPVPMAAKVWRAFSVEELRRMITDLSKQLKESALPPQPKTTPVIGATLGINSTVKILDGPHLNKSKKHMIGKVGTVFSKLPNIVRQAGIDNTIRIGVRFSDAKHPRSKLFRDIVWLWEDNVEVVNVVNESVTTPPPPKITQIDKEEMLLKAKMVAEEKLKSLAIYRQGAVKTKLQPHEIMSIDWEETGRTGTEQMKLPPADLEF